MTDVMTPSNKSITKGQAGKFCDVFADALVKSGLPSEPTQQVLEDQGVSLANECVALVRKRVEVITGMIIRRLKVDRRRTSKQVLDATTRKQYVTDSVVAKMPGKGDGVDEVEVHFFKLDRFVSDDDLEKEYELRGLKPADPYSQAAVNEADPAFADDHPNGTHWKDADGKWCLATFDRWYDGRGVVVVRSGGGWSGYWWFAGLRK